jgi:hypothetical protein
VTDRELNEKLARLCGFPSRAPADYTDAGGYPFVPVYPQEERLYMYSSPHRNGVLWNPVEDWQQVHEFVIPAMNEMGFDVAYVRQATGGFAIRITYGDDVMQLENHPDDLTPTRTICEAALEMFEKLGATR